MDSSRPSLQNNDYRIAKHMNSEKNPEKTNVMRVLDARKIRYISHFYTPDANLSGEDIARLLGEDPSCVYKTLVTQGKSGQHYVFVIPVAAELDLKKAARAAGEKSVAMIPQKELLPLTGYVHGGCSPVGMKKMFPTFVHLSAETQDRICVSAGRVGAQIEIASVDLLAAVRCSTADLI